MSPPARIPRLVPLPTLGNMKHSFFGIAKPKNEFFEPACTGHHVLSLLFGRNDIFTTIFTARIGRGKLQWGVITSRRLRMARW